MRHAERSMNLKGPSETAPQASQGSSTGVFIDILRAVSIIMLIVGVMGSLFFMFRAGQQTPRLLLILFTIWVLSPFVLLLWAHRVSKSWAVLTRCLLYWVTLIVSCASLAIYGEWINIRPVGSANAFLFVAVPPVSVLFITISVSIAAFIAGRKAR
jgi:hypothetical protein